MNKNWTALFEHTFKPPKTVAEAVDRLLEMLSDEEKMMVSLMDEEDLFDPYFGLALVMMNPSMKEDDLFNLHFGLGLAIRNAFGLHEPGSKLLASCGTSHPNDASWVIISALWRALQTWEP